MIIPDKIPSLEYPPCASNEKYAVYVNSYSLDEPIEEVIAASELLDSVIKIYCTGKIPPKLYYLKAQPYRNIYFTDFIDDTEYFTLLTGAQCMVALTTEEDCLQCAAYEGLSLNIPMVISNTKAHKSFLNNSVILVKNKAEDIVEGIKTAMARASELKTIMPFLKKDKIIEHQNLVIELNNFIAENVYE